MSEVTQDRQKAVDALNREWLACPYCDTLWRRPQLAERERVKCGRCHSVILTNKHRSAERTIALMLASLILYGVAVSFPFMRMERSGLSNEISVIDSIRVLWDNGMPNLAVICGAFILLFPLSRIVLLFFVGLSLYRVFGAG